MRFSFDGKQVRISTDTDDRKTAETFYHKTMGEVALGKWNDIPESNLKTLGDLADKYLADHSKPNKTPKSYIRDRGILKCVLGVIGNETPLSAITGEVISNWKRERRGNGAAPGTINKEMALLSHLFTLSIAWGWGSSNPCTRIPREKVRNMKERWVTEEEEVRLLSVASQRIAPIIAFALNTGFRRGEILSLTWDQVNLSRRMITFWDQKNGGRDSIPLNDRALNILSDLYGTRSLKTSCVFLTSNGTAYSERNITRDFNLAVKKSGIAPVRFHDLRHTFATRLVHAGVDLYTVQRLGRWRTLSMVMRYAHHNVDSLRASMDAVQRIGDGKNIDSVKVNELLAQN